MMMVIGGPSKGDDEKPSFGGKSKDEDESEGGSMLSGMGRKKAAKDILRAIEDGDASALDKALAAHYSACEDADEPDEADEK